MASFTTTPIPQDKIGESFVWRDWLNLLGTRVKEVLSPPVIKTADTKLANSDTWVINNKAGSTCTISLPKASDYPGRAIHFLNRQAFTVVSNASNVVPLAGGAPTTAILAAGAGANTTLVSDGSNWIKMQ
jgi:hypothetical protein